ncbi:MAG: ABC transporter permease [Lachnospiraceae bacterium]|nr:ABC transporter permease [Lachnospiraceae bacterium]
MNIKLKSGRLPENANEVVLSDAVMADGASITVGDIIESEYFTRSITGINKNREDTIFPLYNIVLKYGETVEVPQDFPYYEENDSFRENKDYSGKKQKLTVVGIIEAPYYEKIASAAYTAITMLDGNGITAHDKFNLSVKVNMEKYSLASQSAFQDIVGEREIVYNDYVFAFSGKSSDSTINILVIALTVFFVVLIMFVSVFLIYNVFNMSFDERSRYLGMLSSIGATGRQKKSSIYYEAFYLLVFALPAGILSGLGIVKLGMMAIQPFIGEMMSLSQYIEGSSAMLIISWKAIVAIVVVSTITVLISAYFPARKVGKIGSIECIRGNIKKKTKQYKTNKSITKHGSAEKMLAGNTLKRQSKKTRSITAASVTFIVIVIVAAFGSSVIEKVVEKKLDNEDVKPNVEKWDYSFSMADRKENESIRQEIRQAEGIAETAEWYYGAYGATVPKDCYSKEYWEDVHEIYNNYYQELYNRKLSDKEFNEIISDEIHHICFIGLDAKTLKEVAKATGTDIQTLENTDQPAAIVVQEGAVSTDQIGMENIKLKRSRFYDVKQMTDKKIGESLPVELYSEKEDKISSFPIQIAGYAVNKQIDKFISIRSGDLYVFVSADIAKQISKLTQYQDGTSMMVPIIYIKTEGENVEIIDRLQNLSEMGREYLFMKADYTNTLRNAIIGIVHVLLICFVLLTSVICMLNMFNSIRSRVDGKAREFAIMESIGMTKKQMAKMLLYESVGIVIKSILYAGFVAFPLMYMIQYGMIKMFGTVTMEFPWIQMIVAILFTILAVVGLTKYSFKKEKYENIMERIRNENV